MQSFLQQIELGFLMPIFLFSGELADHPIKRFFFPSFLDTSEKQNGLT